jgi:vitamin B12 transporter
MISAIPRRALALALLAAAPTLAHAQQRPATPDSLPPYLMEGITVTSRRAPELRATVPQKIDVVTRTDLDRTVGNDVADALVRDAGLDVIQYPGLLSGVSIRGFRPQFSGINSRTLVLLDGRPAGATNLATLDLAAVERIEVLKGPASALYGSNAMGGVINIVTRRSSGPLHGAATARYGSFQTYRGDARVGGSLAPRLDFDATLSASGRGAGYRTGSRRTIGGETIVKSLQAGGTVKVRELVGDTTFDFTEYQSHSGSARVAYALSPRWSAHAAGDLFAADHVQNAGDVNSALPFPSLNDLSRRSGEAGVDGSAGRHSLRLRGYASRETTSYYDDARNPTFVSFRSPIRWYGAELQDVAALGRHTITAGLDYRAAEQRSEAFDAAGSPTAPFSPNSGIYSAAAFAEAKLRLLGDRLTATLGGRVDRVDFSVKETPLLSRFGVASRSNTVVNPSGGLVYLPGGGTRLHASGGRAFVNPDAFFVAGYSERSPGNGRKVAFVTRGNPDLRPESSVSWDVGAGVDRPRQGIDLDLTYFHTNVRDRIFGTSVPTVGTQLTASGDTILSVGTYRNSERAEIRGIEARAGYDFGAAAGYDRSLRVFINATRFLRAEEITFDITSDIRNVADLTAVFGAEYDDLRRFSTRLSGRYVGERLDFDFSDFANIGDVRYPAFLVFDATASLRVAERYRLGVLLGNLTDENYYEVRGYNLPGRSVQLQLGVDF